MQSGTFHRFVVRPQQLPLRKVLFQVHLWAGLILALYLVAIGLSGSVLVFKDDLMPRPARQGLHPEINACTPAGLLQAMHAAALAHPSLQPVLASCPTAADPFFAVNLHHAVPADDRQLTVYVHPFTMQVMGEVDQAASWVGVLDRFHMDLLMRQHGHQWNGVGGAVLTVLVLSGLVLWWPGIRSWPRAFKVSLRARWKRINWDLHSATGIWTFVFTLLWAVTAIYFAWPRPFEQAVNRVSPITTARYPAEALEHLAYRTVMAPLPEPVLSAPLEASMQLSAGAHLEGMFLGSGAAPILTVYMARQSMGDYTHTDFLYFDQVSGRHLYTWHRGQNHTLGDWLLWLLVPLHFGTSWGLPGKIAWAALGLALPVLTVTGLLMYWNRTLRRMLLGRRSG